MLNTIGRLADIIYETGFLMDTKQAYGRMEKANRIIEDFPVGKYALYTVMFLAEVAICFAIFYAIQA